MRSETRSSARCRGRSQAFRTGCSRQGAMPHGRTPADSTPSSGVLDSAKAFSELKPRSSGHQHPLGAILGGRSVASMTVRSTVDSLGRQLVRPLDSCDRSLAGFVAGHAPLPARSGTLSISMGCSEKRGREPHRPSSDSGRQVRPQGQRSLSLSELSPALSAVSISSCQRLLLRRLAWLLLVEFLALLYKAA